MALEFDQGIVSGLVKETLGEIYFVKAQRPRMLIMKIQVRLRNVQWSFQVLLNKQRLW